MGLIGALRSTGEPPFPLLYRELCAYIQLTGCRGPAEGRVEIQYADTGDLVIRTRSRTLPLPTDPPRRDGLQFSIAQLPVPTSWAVLGTILVQ